MTLSLNSIVVASQTQVSSELQDESVILDIQSGTYYGLNEVGSSIWTLVQKPQTVAAVQDAIQTEYDVSAEQCRHDVFALLNQLIDLGLVCIQHEALT